MVRSRGDNPHAETRIRVTLNEEQTDQGECLIATTVWLNFRSNLGKSGALESFLRRINARRYTPDSSIWEMEDPPLT